MSRSGQNPGDSTGGDRYEKLAVKAGSVFTPASPIDDRRLFAGRTVQIQKTADTIQQQGQHAVLYGERGVGKTSLANIIKPLMQVVLEKFIATKVNCDGQDTFGSVWIKALRRVGVSSETEGAGFGNVTLKSTRSLADSLPEDPRPDDILVLLQSLPFRLLVIFDEFDRLARDVAKLFTDVIKMLSDYDVPATVLMVGVSDTVEGLVEDHASIERALVQIPMPRMKPEELRQILQTASEELSIDIPDAVARRIVHLSQGLPHYTHLIGLHSVRAALAEQKLIVEETHFHEGIERAVEDTQHSIKERFRTATASSRRNALFEDVLLACALAPKDEFSRFQAADVVEPMSQIMGTTYKIPSFVKHLNAFCGENRGGILEKSGDPRRIRYRFTHPLLPPYVVMRGLATKRISIEVIEPR